MNTPSAPSAPSTTSAARTLPKMTGAPECRVPTTNLSVIAGRVAGEIIRVGSGDGRTLKFTLHNEDPIHPVSIPVVMTGPAADYWDHQLRAGDPVVVNGRIGVRQWSDPDGCHRASAQIHAAWIEQL